MVASIPTGAINWDLPLNAALNDLQGQISSVVVNAKTIYGAKGDGTTDDTGAIQAALDACPAGGIVYLPLGVYRTSAPIKIPPYVTLRGTHGGGEAQSTSAPTPSCIKPLASFSGVAVIQILDQQLGGYSTLASEVKIENLTVNGSAVPTGTSVDGIRATGQIQHVQLRDVQLRQMTGQGFNTTYNLSAPPGPQAPFCLHFERVSVLWCKNIGVTLNNATDSYFSDVYVLGCSSFGWYIAGASGSTWVGCRAEWSGLDGFYLASNSGVETFIGCSTDRNTNNGFTVPSSTSTGAVVLSGCRMTRDGKGSTTSGFAGLNVSGNTVRKVIVDSVIITTGRDDDGVTGNLSPQYGVNVSGSAYVNIVSGAIDGVSSSINNGGSNTFLQTGAAVTGSSISRAKGDLATRDSSGASATVTVGADGQLLTADSTQPGGLKWSQPTLNAFAAPTTPVPMGGQKLTGLANGAASSDAAAFGQIPVAGTTAGTFAAGNDSRITGALPASGGTMAGTFAGTPTFSGVPSFSQSLRIGTSSALGDNGVGEIQLADAATVPTTNPSGGSVIYSKSAASVPVQMRDVSGNVRGLVPARALSSAAETNSTTTQQASTSLTVPVEAGATYQMTAFLVVQSPSGVSFVHSFTGPSGATMTWGDNTATFVGTITGTDTWSGSGANKVVSLHGTLITAATAGNLVVTFASATAGQTATLGASSWLRLDRVK
jgi:hypothetical protein